MFKISKLVNFRIVWISLSRDKSIALLSCLTVLPYGYAVEIIIELRSSNNSIDYFQLNMLMTLTIFTDITQH